MMVNIEDFAKLGLVTGKVLEVCNHPNADKLYILKVDIGEKVIQLIAGLRNHYTIEELEGKIVAVVTNLEPKILRGVESQGMLLAAQSEDTMAILTPDKTVKAGSIIK